MAAVLELGGHHHLALVGELGEQPRLGGAQHDILLAQHLVFGLGLRLVENEKRVTDLDLEHIRELPRVLPGLFARAAVRAEKAGFDSGWVTDDLLRSVFLEGGGRPVRAAPAG